MAQTGFKHITVSAPDDDDDMVVWAGQKDAECPEEGGREHQVSESAAQSDTAPIRSTGRTTSDKRDDYRPTTIEDLEHEPMPKIQRIVIIAAVVCIIGAIVYCLVKMG